MTIKVKYRGMRIGGWEKVGETVMELPDSGFPEQYEEFKKKMGKLAEREGFVDLRDEKVEEWKSAVVRVGDVIDNHRFMFDGWIEITTTDEDGTVHTLYDSYDDVGKEIPAELLIEPIGYMVVSSNGKLRIDVR